MRGTIGGKRDVIPAATATANPVAQPALEVKPGGSNTLQSKDPEATEALRAGFVEATAGALADGSAPRLGRSRSWS
jgi:hypothetical protein